MIKPRALGPGDRLAVVAPASPFDRAVFDRGIGELRTLGFEPVFDETVFERRAYVAGSMSTRAAALVAAWRDPSIAGIVAARGGYGSAQLLPLLDSATVRRGRKVLLGCSDVTSLLTFVTTGGGLVAFHGPMVVTLGAGEGGYDRESLMGQLTRPRPFGEMPSDGVEVVKPGRARGPLLGGTLTQLVASFGTPFAFRPPAGFVLLLDDVGERPYRIDRMLTQLHQSGVLSRASAVVCAEFPECDEPGADLTARSVIADRLAGVTGPVLFGLPTGHTAGRPMQTLPLGVDVTVDAAAAGRLIIEEAAVA